MVIQLHGDEDESFIQTLKEQSNVEVWKAVQVRSAADAEKWIDSSADMLLFDAVSQGPSAVAQAKYSTGPR